MFILMPVIFILGILAIALEDKIKINKAADSFALWRYHCG